MSPRISSAEAMTYPLSLNPLKRHWEVMRLLDEAAQEVGQPITVRGILGRSVLVNGLRTLEEAEVMEHMSPLIDEIIVRVKHGEFNG